LEITMIQERETKNTVRFSEQAVADQPERLGTLYVPKSTLAELKNPTTIVVTLAGE
jgi:hypothetical protein